jgi:hypothetical protein
MKIVEIYQYEKSNSNLGERVAIKDVDKADFDKILKLIKKLGLKRDFKEEKDLQEFAENSKLSSDNKNQFVYRGKMGEADIIYNNKSRFLSITWKYKDISAKKLIELIMNED